MATTKLWAIKGGGSSTGVVIKNMVDYVENPDKTTKEIYVEKNISVEATISNVINYSMQQKKTEVEKYVSAVNCSVKNAIQEMMITKSHWKTSGNRLMWHGYQSFAPGEVTPEQAHQIGVKLAKELFGDRFEVVIATHLDRLHIHNHFVINAVSFVDGKKLDWDTYYPQMQQISDKLCKENSLSVVMSDHNSGHYHRGAVRAETEGRPTLESIMIEDVDACILKAKDMNDFFQLMRRKGYRINTDRMYLRIYPPGRNKCIRLDRRMRDKYNQGDDYTLEGIEARITENKMRHSYSDSFISENMKDEENLQTMISEDALVIPDNQDAYFTSRGIKKGVIVSEISAYYIRYFATMGIYPVKSMDTIVSAHYYFREDILKLDKYIDECKLLIDNNIETKDDLTRFKGEQIRLLQEMKSKRSKIQNKIRRCSDSEKKDELKVKLFKMNKEIKEQKKIVFYCNDIEKSQTDMKRKVELVEKGIRGNGVEKISEMDVAD